MGQDETFNYDAPVIQHQLSINGGNDKMTYFLSVGYFKQEGIVGGNYGRSNYERLTARSNSVYTVFEEKSRNFLNQLKVGVNLGYTRDTSTGIETNSGGGTADTGVRRERAQDGDTERAGQCAALS